ncbi:hypothetical protein ACFQ3N_08265 [Virgibacillus byunsanensis]|uniref:DUF4023 domain-containing protein n=1 Tax=Virgibacillus byunsanensis TaxID=570945 RepID=A0ABW3LL53_9BACI
MSNEKKPSTQDKVQQFLEKKKQAQANNKNNFNFNSIHSMKSQQAKKTSNNRRKMGG